MAYFLLLLDGRWVRVREETSWDHHVLLLEELELLHVTEGVGVLVLLLGDAHLTRLDILAVEIVLGDCLLVVMRWIGARSSVISNVLRRRLRSNDQLLLAHGVLSNNRVLHLLPLLLICNTDHTLGLLLVVANPVWFKHVQPLSVIEIVDLSDLHLVLVEEWAFKS